MSEFLQRVAAAVEKRRLLPRGQKVLIAVSGGVDSMVLLHALHALAAARHWKISIAHFNHHLRGRASDADEKLVRQTAARLRLKCFVAGADVKATAAQAKVSIEMAARKLRHEFLARTAREQKIPTVALAHHADDQVELFFLRLLRGTGGEGLAGMKWRAPSPADHGIALIRPLLDCAKTDLLTYARENKIRFREDATNFSTDFLRNRIRRELLPLLRKKYQPAVDKTVLRLMDIVGAEAEFVRDFAARQRGDFEFLPLAVQRRILQQQLTGLALAPDFDLVEQLRTAPGKAVSVAAGLSVLRDGENVRLIQAGGAAETPFSAAELKLKLSRQGAAKFGGSSFTWKRSALKKPIRFQKRMGQPATPATEYFDADKIGGEIILRHWRAGDRFQPIGMKVAVKLQDLFVNAKIPAARRHELIIGATARGEIFWVQSLRIGERFKLTASTRHQLAWRTVN